MKSVLRNNSTATKSALLPVRSKCQSSGRPARRPFSVSTNSELHLRIGYVPEHFSTPLYFAKKYHGLLAELIPFPSGTGHMINALKDDDLDVGIGLTEAWVAGLGGARLAAPYKFVGTYVHTPLRWAISAGKHTTLRGLDDLRRRRIGVSRIGRYALLLTCLETYKGRGLSDEHSGSYIMAYVLAQQNGQLNPSTPPFDFVPLQTFDRLRQAVNDGTVDFFLWEDFTCKRYFDNGEIKRLGEIYTPWSSWMIVSRVPNDPRIAAMLASLDNGVAHFQENRDESIHHISTELDYTAEDAKEWLTTVKFANDTRGVDRRVIQDTIDALQKANVLPPESMPAHEMIEISTKI